MNKAILSIIINLFTPFLIHAQTIIDMDKRGDVYYLSGKVNGLPLEFVFDTGASNVCLSLSEAYFMLKNGYLNESDLGETSISKLANGQTVENIDVNLREIVIGNITLKNVSAVIVKELNAPLLLGQSAIQKLGTIQLSGNKLIISGGKAFPSTADALKLYQQAYQQVEAQQYNKAISTSLEALNLTSDSYLRGLLYDNIGTAYHRKGEIERAIEFTSKALEEDYMCIQAQYNLGVFYFEKKQMINALRAFELFLEKTDNGRRTNIRMMDISDLLPNVFEYLGKINANLHRFRDAENNLLKSISMRPSISTYLTIAQLYADNNENIKAANYYEKTIALDPNRPNNFLHFHQIGMCYVFANEYYPQAYDAFKRCIAAAISHKDYLKWCTKEQENKYYYCLTNSELWVARTSMDPYECIDIYENHLFQMPDSIRYGIVTEDDYIRLFQAYNRIGNVEKGLSTINAGLKTLVGNQELMFIKSSLLDVSNPTKLELLKQILYSECTYKPRFFDYGIVNSNIAYIYCYRQDPSTGLPYAMRAVKQNPEHSSSWETLGRIYFCLGKYKECIDAMSECLNLNDDNTKETALKIRSLSYQKLGLKVEAEQDARAIKNLKKQ